MRVEAASRVWNGLARKVCRSFPLVRNIKDKIGRPATRVYLILRYSSTLVEHTFKSRLSNIGQKFRPQESHTYVTSAFIESPILCGVGSGRVNRLILSAVFGVKVLSQHYNDAYDESF